MSTTPLLIGIVWIVAVMVGSHPRRYEIVTLVVGVSAGLVGVQIANVHVFTALVTLWWVLSPGRRGSRAQLMPLVLLGSSLAVAATSLTGDLVNNPKLGFQLVALALNACMVVSRSTIASQRLMLQGLLLTCTAGSLYGLGQVVGLFPTELWHREVSSFGRPPAFYPEPDWLGLFATIGIVLSWRLLRDRTVLRYAVILVNLAGSAMAFARAPWVGLAAAIAVFWIATALSRRTGSQRRTTIRTALVVCAFGIVAMASVPGLANQLTSRLSTLGGPRTDDVSGQARIQQNDGLWALADTAPPFGHGLSASGHVGVSGRYVADSANNVGSNWMLSLWVDAHYLAIPLIVLVLALAIRWGRTVPGQLLMVVCVNNLFSNATFQPITWLLLGMTAALPTLVGRSRKEANVADNRHESDRVSGLMEPM